MLTIVAIVVTVVGVTSLIAAEHAASKRERDFWMWWR